MEKDILEKSLSDLSNKSYIFSINVISFAKTLQKRGFEAEIVNNFVNLSGNMADTLLDTADLKNTNEIIVNLEKSSTFAQKLFQSLQDFKSEGTLLNEKVDLQIESHLILKRINSLLSDV